MTGGSLGVVCCTSSSRLQIIFLWSVVSCWSVVLKKTGSSCAMPVGSMFTSNGFVGMSSLISKIIFSLGSISKLNKKPAAVLFSLESVQ